MSQVTGKDSEQGDPQGGAVGKQRKVLPCVRPAASARRPPGFASPQLSSHQPPFSAAQGCPLWLLRQAMYSGSAAPPGARWQEWTDGPSGWEALCRRLGSGWGVASRRGRNRRCHPPRMDLVVGNNVPDIL